LNSRVILCFSLASKCNCSSTAAILASKFEIIDLLRPLATSSSSVSLSLNSLFCFSNKTLAFYLNYLKLIFIIYQVILNNNIITSALAALDFSRCKSDVNFSISN
jgi:hypothetical protein